MNKTIENRINWIVITAGCWGVVVGVLLKLYTDDNFKLMQLPPDSLLNISLAVLSTGLTNLLLKIKLDKMPLDMVSDALSDRTDLIRKNHSLTLNFVQEGEKVHLTKEHKFILKNPSSRTIRKELRMYTETLAWRHLRGGKLIEVNGGFTLISENNNRIEKSQLAYHPDKTNPIIQHTPNGMAIFSKEYTFTSGAEIEFEFHSHEYYRLTDRLVWTVEHLSDDFSVTLNNHTKMLESFQVKINHHRGSEIHISKVIDAVSNEKSFFRFGTYVLPYQGFEVLWDLEPDKG